MKIRISLSIILCLVCAAPAMAQTAVDFSWTQTDTTTGSGTITGNFDTTSVGGPGVLPFSGALPLPTINQKDATGVTLPSGIVGFLSEEGGPSNGTPNGVHLGWTGSVSLTATDGNTIYSIDVPLTLPTTNEPFSWSADMFDNNGAGNDADGTTTVAGYVGTDGSGHRHTGNEEDWLSGVADVHNFSANFNLGSDGQGDPLGITYTVREGDLFPGGDPIFIDTVTFSGELVADDNSLAAMVVPEPASVFLWGLVGLGVAAFMVCRRKLFR